MMSIYLNYMKKLMPSKKRPGRPNREMEGKVVVCSPVKDLCHQIQKRTERLNVMPTNEKTASMLSILKNVNPDLEKRITVLEKSQTNADQYNRRNNVEIIGISNDVLDNDLEKKVIGICKDSDIFITSSDIEGCDHLPMVRNRTSENKRVIVTFVHRKHSELTLRLKKNISSKSIY